MYCKRLNAEAGMRIQTSIKPDITEICKNVKLPFFSICFLVLENMAIFNFKMLLTIT